MYQIFSYLPEDIAYHCRLCYPMRPAPWETILRDEMQTSFLTVIGNMLATKLVNQLTRIEDEVRLSLVEAFRMLRPNPHRTRDATQRKWNLLM